MKIKEYEVEVARRQDTGAEIPGLVTIHTSTPLHSFYGLRGTKAIERFQHEILDSVEGVDLLEPTSMYSFRLIVAKCFDITKVIDAVLEKVTEAQSPILAAKLHVSS